MKNIDYNKNLEQVITFTDKGHEFNVKPNYLIGSQFIRYFQSLEEHNIRTKLEQDPEKKNILAHDYLMSKNKACDDFGINIFQLRKLQSLYETTFTKQLIQLANNIKSEYQ